jgi:L,D-transpeptidase ErfK/SrfK
VFRFLSFACLLVGLAAPPPAAGNAMTDIVGFPTLHVVSGKETFVELMAVYDVGYIELIAANPGVDPWLPPAGAVLDIPTAHLLPRAPRRGIVVNLAEMRLYRFPAKPGMPESFPIGIGQEGWSTPLGDTKVVKKLTDPVWYPPASIRAERPELPGAVPPGPDNPLGGHALYLDWDAYLIHGTNRPGGIGRRVSHGCIRLAPDNIARLFAMTPPGTPVTIVDEPVKVGWANGELWLEVHPSQRQADELETRGAFTPEGAPGAGTRILAAAADAKARLDWPAIARAIAQRRGVPVRITVPER